MIFNSIFLGLGSNLGEPFKTIPLALLALKSYFKIKQISSYYQTKALGPKQNDFINLVIPGDSQLSPQELLMAVKRTEQELGRSETYRWGPRIIDIDILFYKELYLCQPDLIIPHPEIKNRRFVLEPLLEIAGNLPINNQTLLHYLNQTLGQKCEKISPPPFIHSFYPSSFRKRFK